MEDPSDFEGDSFRRIKKEDLVIIIGKKKGKDTTSTQALRYPTEDWNEARARAHCEEEGGTFEAAAGADKTAEGDDDMSDEQKNEQNEKVLAGVKSWLAGKLGLTAEPTAPAAKDESLAEIKAEMEALKAKVAEQEKVLAATKASGEAVKCREDSHLPPAFDVSLADLIAGESDVRLDEAGTKKLPRGEFVARLLVARTTQKLTDPLQLAEATPPAKESATKAEKLPASNLPNDPDALEELAEEADALAKSEHIPVNEAMAKVLAARNKEGE